MQIDKLTETLKNEFALSHINGGSLIIVKEKSEILNFGEIDIQLKNEYITDKTLFQIGSVTKVFTALLTAHYISQGDIKLTTNLGDILVNLKISDSLKKVTIFQLLTHSSGLPRLPTNFMKYYKTQDNPYQYYGETALIEYLENEIKIGSPKMEYSNLGYGILGYLLEKVVNKSFQLLLTDIICKPLMMNDTVVYSTDISLKNISKGYDADNIETPPWDMNILKAAGGILSTPADMEKFLTAILSGDSNIENIISKSLIPLTNNMAYGWMRKSILPEFVKSNDNLWHNGMTGGFASYIEISREKRRGYVLLLNKAVYTDKLNGEIASFNHKPYC